MTEDAIKEYYELTDEFSTILLGMKWLKQEGNPLHFENIVNQSEKLWRKFLTYGINNIGSYEE